MPKSVNEVPPKTWNVLIADDDEGDRKQIIRALKQARLPVTLTETATIHEALEACAGSAFDCVFLDYLLPGQDGLAGIRSLHAIVPALAIVMVTGHGDEMVATEAMRRGALDYIPKTSISADSIKRSLENAIQKANLLRVLAVQRDDLENFSRVLVHDLRQPLNSALAFATLVEDRINIGKPEEFASYARTVVASLERLAVLIDTLHRYTTGDDPDAFAPLAMNDVMRDTLYNLDDLVQRRGAQVTYDPLPVVRGTPQLAQLLQNLIANGIKYCEAKVPSVHVTARPKGEDLWLFSVSDNGIGIPENEYKQVFEPFHRLRTDAKYEGTGLGLATCKKIVERHGGTIACQSEKDQGTTFLFTLRRA